jgi:hypothetical protein
LIRHVDVVCNTRIFLETLDRSIELNIFPRLIAGLAGPGMMSVLNERVADGASECSITTTTMDNWLLYK